MRTEFITSVKNPKIKQLLSLMESSSQRRKEQLFVVEGVREVERCIDAGFKIRSIFLCNEIVGEEKVTIIEETMLSKASNCTFFNVSKYVYEKIAYRGGTEGIIAEVEYRDKRLEDIVLKDNPLIIVLESVEKPGNIGAVLRSVDAAGADAMIVCNPLTDLYNPNLIRASTGAVFSKQIACSSSEDTIKWLKSNKIQILTAQLQNSTSYYDTDMTIGTAIVMGTESTGLSEIWRKAANRHIKIPMLGSVDSLNVSVSAAILMYEAIRQRNSK